LEWFLSIKWNIFGEIGKWRVCADQENGAVEAPPLCKKWGWGKLKR